jgi:hypothetical protein
LHGQITNSIWLTGKIIPANTKVNKTNSKSIRLTPNPACGISFAPANGKLCFEYLKTFSVPENHLPFRFMLRGKMHAEVVHFWKGFNTNSKKPAGFHSKAGGLLCKRRRAFQKRSVSVLKKPAGFCSSLNFK